MAQQAAQAGADHCTLYSISCVQSSLSTGYRATELTDVCVNFRIREDWFRCDPNLMLTSKQNFRFSMRPMDPVDEEDGTQEME